MAFLTLDGEDFDVVSGSGVEDHVAGKVARMFSGQIRSSVRKTATSRTFVLFEMSKERFEILKGIVGNGAPIPVTGDALPAPINASVRISSFQYVRDGVNYLIVPTIEIEPE